MKLAFIIGYGGPGLEVLRKALNNVSKEANFQFIATTPEDVKRHLEFIENANAIFIYAYELDNDVLNVIRKAGEKGALIYALPPNYVELTTVGPDELARAIAYFKTGGIHNLENLTRSILRRLGVNVEVGPLEEIPWHGIYHPRLGTFRTLDEYLSRYGLEGRRGVVGLLFYRSHWLYGDLRPIDVLVNALEDEGLGVIPVFTYGHKDEVLNTPTKEDSIREFFVKDGKRAIDVLIDLTFFFLLDHGDWHRRQDRLRIVSGIELLKSLGIPIICPAKSFWQTIGEWRESPIGIDYLSQVYSVIMPEVDGLIEPIFYIAIERKEDMSKKYVAFEEHAKYLARRVRRWIELAKKPPKERKIAIVLINPPCKNVQAQVAVGHGLDVPESISRLLWRLFELGYDVGPPERLPRDGRELEKMILSHKAFSDFRFATVDDIVKSGGAIGFVDIEDYRKWLEELPNEARERLVRNWGDPESLIQGERRDFAGMVWNGKFVVPGLRFGNVVLIPQPKFGCAGPRCDGRVCRILHDPTIVPPHQWLAVYRWITRVFKADLIIHFGTHGYLEFRPGKGVGLAPWDWPEITIDDVPHVYVYVVTNPMEGVMAKRRSYATIVDHLYPPMSTSDLFDEIERLISRYSKYARLGEEAKAKEAFKRLIEVVKEKLPLEIDLSKDPNEIVEEIHEYLDMIRESQINMGLHIFGEAIEDPRRLAEYAITVLLKDSIRMQSIRRIAARVLGLDYDELRRRPHDVNVYGVTNYEALNAIQKALIDVLTKYVEKGSLPGPEDVFKDLKNAFLRYIEGFRRD